MKDRYIRTDRIAVERIELEIPTILTAVSSNPEKQFPLLSNAEYGGKLLTYKPHWYELNVSKIKANDLNANDFDNHVTTMARGVYNLTQIFTHVKRISGSGTLKDSPQQAFNTTEGKQIVEEMMYEFLKELENAVENGQRFEKISKTYGEPIRFMGGLKWFSKDGNLTGNEKYEIKDLRRPCIEFVTIPHENERKLEVLKNHRNDLIASIAYLGCRWDDLEEKEQEHALAKFDDLDFGELDTMIAAYAKEVKDYYESNSVQYEARLTYEGSLIYQGQKRGARV